MSAHLTDCRCLDCFQQLQHDSDRAQAQVQTLFDELASIRERVRALRSSVESDCGTICSQIARHIGAET